MTIETLGTAQYPKNDQNPQSLLLGGIGSKSGFFNTERCFPSACGTSSFFKIFNNLICILHKDCNRTYAWSVCQRNKDPSMWGQNAVYILHTAEIHLITIRAASSDKNNTKSTDCCIQIRSFTCLSFVKFGINPLLHVQLPFFVLGAAYQC